MLGRVLKQISPQLAPIIQLIISLANRSDYLGKKNPEIIQIFKKKTATIPNDCKSLSPTSVVLNSSYREKFFHILSWIVEVILT